MLEHKQVLEVLRMLDEGLEHKQVLVHRLDEGLERKQVLVHRLDVGLVRMLDVGLVL